MDPYLEAPSIWPGVHSSLAVEIRELLVPQLRPRYLVDVERRIYVVSEDDPAQRILVPDLTIVSTPGKEAPKPRRASIAKPAVLLMVQRPVEVSEPRVVIRSVESRKVVTAIEVLSPVNKTRGSRGRRVYLKKRRKLLESRVHLVEIDLLRAGARIPSVDELPSGDYYVHVSRVSMRPRGEVYAWRVREPLPVIPVPLAKGDPDATLDLGLALRQLYDRGGYDLIASYRAPLEPRLPSRDGTWAEKLLAGR